MAGEIEARWEKHGGDSGGKSGEGRIDKHSCQTAEEVASSVSGGPGWTPEGHICAVPSQWTWDGVAGTKEELMAFRISPRSWCHMLPLHDLSTVAFRK